MSSSSAKDVPHTHSRIQRSGMPHNLQDRCNNKLDSSVVSDCIHAITRTKSLIGNELQRNSVILL